MDEYLEMARKLQEYSELNVVGVLTHLPVADTDEEFTERQLAGFREIQSRRSNGHSLVHAQCSAGILIRTAATDFGQIRPGLMLYGVSPTGKAQSELRPVLAWKTRVALVRTLPGGHGVSYGRDFVTTAPQRVATLSMGYADGYPWHLSGHDADVLIRGRRCRVLGRITMDMVVVDVSAECFGDLCAGEEVTLIGGDRDGNSGISASELAEKAKMIPWEILTGASPRGGRVYVDSEEQ